MQRSRGYGQAHARPKDMDLETTARIWNRVLQTMNTLTSLVSILVFPAGLTLVFTGMLYEWIDRKLVARFQNRVGPRWFQPIADVVKLLPKEQITPGLANPFLFLGLPVVAMTGALTSALYVP